MQVLHELVGDSVPFRRRDDVQHNAMFAYLLPGRDEANRGNSSGPGTRARGGLPPCTIRRIRQYVDNHIDQSIRVKTLASIANLSVCYFVRAFKLSMGDTPHEYLMRRRVGVAMQLLSTTKMPLSEIAMAAGFVDQSHCSRRFRQAVGMSPREYRCAAEQLQRQPEHLAARSSLNALISASSAPTSG